jgi:hypothetical protein
MCRAGRIFGLQAGDDPMKRWLIVLTPLLVLAAVPEARAQVTVDIAKITCRDLLFDKVISTKVKSVAMWLSGYYNGKRNNTILDITTLEKNTDRVEDFCRLNQDVNLMQAVEKVLNVK